MEVAPPGGVGFANRDEATHDKLHKKHTELHEGDGMDGRHGMRQNAHLAKYRSILQPYPTQQPGMHSILTPSVPRHARGTCCQQPAASSQSIN